MNFKGQIAIVSGASSGIGRATAISLAELGACVVLLGRQADRLDAAAQQAGERARYLVLDLADDAAISDLPARMEREFGAVDILVHSAGTFSLGRFETAPVEDLDRQYRINVRGPFLLTQALLPMIEAHQGQIVFVNSSAVLRPGTNVSQYVATKQALKGLADALREEVNAAGVRVLSVYPGRTATPMQAAIHEMEGKDYRPEVLIQPADVAAVIIQGLLAPRTAEVTDIYLRPMAPPKAA